MKLYFAILNLGIIILLVAAISSCNTGVVEPQISNEDSTSVITIKEDTIVEYYEPSIQEIISANIDTAGLGMTLFPKQEYYTGIKNIKSKRAYFALQYTQATNEANKNIIIEKAGKFLEDELVNHVFPHWYGTSWEFSGYTDTPQVGAVACGYFVTTTLKHCGFNLNRYKLAQQAGSTGCKTLAIGDKVHTLRNVSNDEILSYFKENLEEGLYHVALAYHVGFVLYRNEQLYFIHSSFITPVCAIIEPIDNSPGFGSSLYLFNRISTNKNLIKKWLLNERIEIKK